MFFRTPFFSDESNIREAFKKGPVRPVLSQAQVGDHHGAHLL